MSRNRYSILLASVVTGTIALPACGDERPTAPTKAEIAAVAKGNNEFAFDLYRQLAKEAKPDENIFFSPYSIQAALAMTYAGARGETAEEMAKVLRFDRDQAKFHPAFAQLSKQIRNPGKEFKGEINVANAIWTSLKVRPTFRQVMDSYYDAGLRNVPRFDDDTRKLINSWVVEQTRQKIKNLLPEGSVDMATNMVLVNAIYLQAKWQRPFPKNRTSDEKFYRTETDIISVPRMQSSAPMLYAKVDNAQIVELLYTGDEFSMVLVLPDEHKKLAAVENALHEWDKWIAKLLEHEVVLGMPKMKLRQKYSLAGNTFPALGMKRAFSGSGDFSGIKAEEERQLPFFNWVIHEAMLEADEAGTTAAAATAIGGRGSAGGAPRVVTLNRPFLLALRDRKESTLLFVGRVITPTNLLASLTVAD